MPLHPIQAVDAVIREYRDYLQTEFRAKDPQLKAALERELDRPLFLAQEPFFQAHRPFRPGARWRDLPIDARLAGVMERRSGSPRAYLHQSESISHLLGPEGSPLVVTTGTGSGKTEAFLLPVIQNAIDDATRFRRSGLTAILLYPMNALANDQLLRIEQYLAEAGWAGAISVKRYDRGTSQTEREEMRQSPPHILLTNYMMLEYLLVRPADRDRIFANHRCRFVVLDEVHTYRGTLGSNIALLVRRARAHLQRAAQDWNTNMPDGDQAPRFPRLLMVGTSATIKSVAEEGRDRAAVLQARDEAVRGFFGTLAGVETSSVRVASEELDELPVPAEAVYPTPSSIPSDVNLAEPDQVRLALCQLADVPHTSSVEDAVRRCRLLWDLNTWLIRAPMSLDQIVSRVCTDVVERRNTDPGLVRNEVQAALALGAALPDGLPGSLRLRVHRFIRGGWRFHRCIDPACGRLYPMGETQCACGRPTAPLYVCRNCGADYLRLVGDPQAGPLRPSTPGDDQPEQLLYEHERLDAALLPDDEEEGEEDDQVRRPAQQARPVVLPVNRGVRGSLDPATLAFSTNQADYPMRVTLAPQRSLCLSCGGSAGSRSVLTPVALGTSAAVKVLGEGLVESLGVAHRDQQGHDGKERLLIFSDSRQDAAHQARFITFASRYDRMRRRVAQILQRQGILGFQRLVELLGDEGIRRQDNPHAPANAGAWLPDESRRRVRAWEEAPLLDDVSVTAGYRGTLTNLGLVRVDYERLDEYVSSRGDELAARFGVTLPQLAYICRVVLDDLRVRGCLSREMLRYHPKHPSAPDYLAAAEWERRVKQPRGFAARGGVPIAWLDTTNVPLGITHHNAWRRPGGKGRGPGYERLLCRMVDRLGGVQPDQTLGLDLLEFLTPTFLTHATLFGARESIDLLQVNHEIVRLALVTDAERKRCDICGLPVAGAGTGMPCPRCRGSLIRWSAASMNENRSARRIRSPEVAVLDAAEHTAQVPSDDRVDLEERFKAPAARSGLNVLACSPTLELGIDVGGLDAVILRNIPPRPDNYAQRGGRAGRRTRVGLVLGYCRSTPHDQYFYDRPAEMISGEVPVPTMALGNRDVLLRHLNAIVFGAAEPGLAGRMVEYVSPQGAVNEDKVRDLTAALVAQVNHALEIARSAWGADVLPAADLGEAVLRDALGSLPQKVRDVISRTARQVTELRRPLETYAAELRNARAGINAGELVARLLGLPTERSRRGASEAEDWSAGYPLRRFAEFGILPGYEFPTEPASLRLLGDPHEEEAVTVARRFGLDQFRPEAQVFARRKRWRVHGLDLASPWNPQGAEPEWLYRLCRTCGLRFEADQPRCPRCGSDAAGTDLPGSEYGGFLAVRTEAPILDEEDRYATASLVTAQPQWNGDVVGRWMAANGWALRLSRAEEVRWLNENRPPTVGELQRGDPMLHPGAKGFLLCRRCGRMLTVPPPVTNRRGGRRQARAAAAQDPFGHSENCPARGVLARPTGLVTKNQAEILRLLVPLPEGLGPDVVQVWGLSLGYALRIGFRRLYMLDGPEIEFALEGPWTATTPDRRVTQAALAFIDPGVGGSGYLGRAAAELHLVARRTLEHLDHPGCQTACYRCLKSYQNQRHHDRLNWPRIQGDLEELACEPPDSRQLRVGDLDDPGPWLEAYQAGVGSPLELRFLRLFEEHGFNPQKQVPVAPRQGEPPMSIADFAVPERRLAIYVDGAAFHVGANLRRDRFIRGRLRQGSPPWRVEELRATDLRDGVALVRRLTADESSAS